MAFWPCGQNARRKPGRHRPVTRARETRAGDSRVFDYEDGPYVLAALRQPPGYRVPI